MSAEVIKAPVDASPIIRKAAEVSTKSEFAATLQRLNHYADIITEWLYPRFDGQATPKALIAIADMRINTLAALRIVPDDYALNDKLTMNQKYYRPATEEEIKQGLTGMVHVAGQYGELEILCHELCHLNEEHRGIPYHPGRLAHTQRFVDTLLQIGIHSELDTGIHTAPPDHDKPFHLLMARLGIHPITQTVVEKPKTYWWKEASGYERKGRSSLTKWACIACGLRVWAGQKGDIELIHAEDNGKFIRA